jgi:hypothetical protein
MNGVKDGLPQKPEPGPGPFLGNSHTDGKVR